MKRLCLISLLLFALTALPALAQDDLTHTFMSDDGVFSLQYPDGWTFGQTKATEAFGITEDRSVSAIVDYPSFEPNGTVLTPEAYLRQTISDMGEANLIDPKVTTLQIGGRDAARLDAKSPTYGALMALTVAFPEHLAAFAFIGTDDAIRRQEQTLLAMAASFTLSDNPALTVKGRARANGAASGIVLARTLTASDGGFSIKYPDGWDAVDTGFGAAAIYDGDDVSLTMAYPADDATQETPSTVLGGFFADGKFTNLEINGRPATRIENFKAVKGGVALLVDIDGNYALFLWKGIAEKLKQDEPTLMAMAATFTVAAEADSALTETYSVPQIPYAFRYPADWTIEERGLGNLHFLDAEAKVQGQIQFSNDGKTARQTLTDLMKSAAISPDVVTEIKLGTRTAARTSSIAGDFGVGYYAVDLDGAVMMMIANGPASVFEDEEILLLAIVASVQPVEASSESPAPVVNTSGNTGLLTQSFIAADQSFSFNYPDNWQVTDDKEGINFTGADGALTGVVEYAVSDKNAQQVLADLLKKAGSSAAPATYEANGRTVVYASPSNGTLVLEIFAVDFDQKPVFVLSVLGDVKTIDETQDQIFDVVDSFRDDAKAPLRAIAPSGEIAPDSALTETYADNPAFTFRYPADWQFEPVADEAGALDFESDNKLLNGRLSFGQYGKTAKDYLVDRAAQLGMPASVVRTFDLNGRSAAEATIAASGGAFGSHYIAVDYGDGYVLSVGAAGLMRAFDKGNPLLFGIAASFQPADAGAAEISATAAASAATPVCTVTAASGVNLRAGPGTSFAIAGSLPAGTSKAVVAQDTGADGKIWYQLDDGNWLRSDLVTPGGDCASVPTAA